ncbi:S8 family serine peptidase [Natronospira bacteriovora]|uniref:S8 family serine peptidase n=1 Tax=Natronospira bacteriovora TaxID=3069753 RepID=A0ABU0W5Z8_9GAMM|nr:S8 family serine peptidase [Natronospira sp. AB-CW4]MDQ2069374.1 S8 family serine peptidase [Natronospira sp. AB-CW4]
MRYTSSIAAAALAVASFSAMANSDRHVDVIVSLNDGGPASEAAANRAEASNFAAGFGVQPAHVYGAALTGFAASVPEARLEALRDHPRVNSVTINGRVTTMQGNCPHCGGNGGDDDNGDDGEQTTPWGIERVGADGNNNTGDGISVYILDTGIDASHDDLADNLGNGYAVETCEEGGGGPGGGPFAGGSNDECLADWDDDQGHGTHVAGTVGAIDNDIDVVGVAPDVTLHSVKVLDSGGGGSFAGIIDGIDWVAEQVQASGQPAIANMSLGGGGSKSGECTDSGFSGDDAMHEAICNAKNVGVVFVVAAGNDGADAAGSVPAAYDDAVITVSATSEGDDWTSWSNWGDDSAGWTSNVSAPVAIAAPGAAIESTALGGGTESLSGTSMAAPHVAGGAALLLRSNPQSADASAFHNIRSGLLNTAEDTGSFSNTSGNPHDEDFLDASGL